MSLRRIENWKEKKGGGESALGSGGRGGGPPGRVQGREAYLFLFILVMRGLKIKLIRLPSHAHYMCVCVGGVGICQLQVESGINKNNCQVLEIKILFTRVFRCFLPRARESQL